MDVTVPDVAVAEPTEAPVVEEAPVSEPPEGEVTTESEEVEGSDPQVPKGPQKLTAQERIQQEIERRKELESKFTATEQRLKQLESQFQQQKAPEYVEITPQVQQQINSAIMDLEQKRVEAELDGDYLKAMSFRKQVDEIIQGVEENNKRKAAYDAQMQQQQLSQKMVDSINERAEFYRQVNNIPSDQWNQASNWFTSHCETNPIIGTQFREIAERQGPMAAVQFAAWYTGENMTKKAEAAKAQKEQAKQALPSGASYTGGEITVTTWDELMNLPSEQINRFQKSNPTAFTKLRDASIK